jgi:hypothetical protein
MWPSFSLKRWVLFTKSLTGTLGQALKITHALVTALLLFPSAVVRKLFAETGRGVKQPNYQFVG